MAVAQYRGRHAVAGRKSDHLDAMVLANILRTDAAAHRTLPADSELAQAIAVLARAQQDAVWTAPRPATNSRRTCVSTFPAFWPQSTSAARASPTPSPACCLRQPPLRSRRRS
jgi:hypothetical protein